MDSKTRTMIRDWLDMHNGDVESLARWMRDALKMAGLKTCRALVLEAKEAA